MTTSTTDRIVSDDLLAAYERDGFVVIPDLLTEAEVDHYNEVITASVHRRTGHDLRPLEERSRYEQSFVQCMNLWEDDPEARKLTFHPRLAQVAAELCRVDAIRVWHDQALYKKAGGRPTDAHQDHPYWPMKETNTVTAWIPLEGSTLQNGALGYLPGTHKIGLRKFVNIFFGEPHDILNDDEVKDIEPVFLEVPKGSVAYHHGLTVHLAHGNTTDKDRAVHTIIYFPDGTTRGYPVPHFAVDRPGIEVGEAIRSDVTPIAWPRPAGDLPVPPDSTLLLPGVVANPGATPIK